MITDCDGNILYGAYMHIISHQMHLLMDERLSSFGLTHQQSRVLIYLSSEKNGQNACQHDLTQALNLRRSSVTSLLQNLEKKALITRVSDSQDARIKKVILTSEGRKLAFATQEIIKEMECRLVQNLSEDQKLALSELLDMLLANVI